MVDGFTVEQLTAVATFVVSLGAVALVLATIASARREVLGARWPWLVLAGAVWILSLRVLGHFTDDPTFQLVRTLAGVAGAIALPVALYYVLRGAEERDAA